MKKVIVLSFLFAIVLGAANAAMLSNNKDVTGEWKYEVPSAEPGYDKGTIVISENEGKLAGQVIYEYGSKINLNDVKYADGVLQFGIMVEYESFTVKANIEGKKLEGKVIHAQGEMEITGKKVK
jgi:hypothetical protein